MSAQLKTSSQIAERPADVQMALVAGVYSFLYGDCLELYESDARRIERCYGLLPETQHLLGYRSAPQPTKFFREIIDYSTSNWLDTLPDDVFLDWFTYSKEPLFPSSVSVQIGERNLQQDFLERAIAERFGEIEGIPGIYIDDRLRVKLPHSGVLVPCRMDSITRAMLCYPRADEDKTFWLSSNGLHGGARARASLHVSNQHRAAAERVCVVVSHAIEADALAWQSGECVVAVNGLSSLRVARELRAVLPDLKGCMVSVADSDRLARTLRENGLRVRVEETEGRNDE